MVNKLLQIDQYNKKEGDKGDGGREGERASLGACGRRP